MNIFFEKDLFLEEESIWISRGARSYLTFFDDRDVRKFEPTIARGSIQFHHSVESAFRYKKWPNLMWPFDNSWNKYDYKFLLNCEGILNHDAVFYKNIDELINYGDPKYFPLWVRSNSGTKQFTGGVFTQAKLLEEKNYMDQNNLLDVELVTAIPKHLYQEYRFIFIGGKYISSSMYMDQGEKKETSDVSDSLIRFATVWASNWGHNWNGTFVVDIVETANGRQVVEVNNLLTSGWYSCDIEKVVDEVIKTVELI